MRGWQRFLAGALLCCTAATASAQAPFSDAPSLTQVQEQRSRYQQALEALERGQWQDFEREREALRDYPLAAYLDYERLLRRLSVTSGENAREFVDAQSSSPLGVRYLGQYLRVAGKGRRWGDYLEAARDEPRSEDLRCYYARAKRGRGEQEQAWDLASRLWVSPRSVDDTCDPLFGLWRKSGGLDDSLVWERSKLTFAARQSSLLRYVTSLGSPAAQAQLQALRQSYREPNRSIALSQSLPPELRSDVRTLGLERYSRYDPGAALDQWQSLEQAEFSAGQVQRIESAIAFRGLIERDEAVRDWVDARLAAWGNDRLTELRLRWAIAETSWTDIDRLFFALSASAQEESVWRYWYARSLENSGRAEDSQRLLAIVAAERSYYGFLSADRLGMPYSYRDAKQLAPEVLGYSLPDWASAALWRVHELDALGEQRLAQSEWTHSLQRLDGRGQVKLAHIAREQGWHRFAIDAANAGRSWDSLDLRFPLAYVDDFYQRAAAQSLPVSELMAIARRESAFAPNARSPVGARGLMQLMPATGRAVARREGLRVSTRDLYKVDYNITLGSAYYKQLLERFDGNRAVALAAYNAGPNRVKNWLGSGLPLDAWIETIPYRETRDYVKAVLAYSVVFDYRLGEKAQLLGAAERHARY